MANLKEWLLEQAGDEPIEAVVIGEMGWGDYQSEMIPNYHDMPKGELLSWDEAARWLDYDFDCGFGAPEGQAVCSTPDPHTKAVMRLDLPWPHEL